MHRPFKLILITLLMLIAAVSAVAQNATGEVNGKIVSSRGSEPLSLVQVDIQGTSLRTVTAEDGTFHIPAVPPGNYVLQASAVGFYSNRIEFAVAAGDVIVRTICSARSDSRRLSSSDRLSVGLVLLFGFAAAVFAFAFLGLVWTLLSGSTATVCATEIAGCSAKESAATSASVEPEPKKLPYPTNVAKPPVLGPGPVGQPRTARRR